MAHVKEQRPWSLEVVGASSEEEEREEPARAARPPVTRTPPRVWPQVSQADVGRVVRRLRRDRAQDATRSGCA
ncbi:hypothetical protein [Melittangium boletus]|uniref:hypothetical protein n=1 Tax=Melittangium boletus TaxID=83453 RepID=UPI003DA1CD39